MAEQVHLRFVCLLVGDVCFQVANEKERKNEDAWGVKGEWKVKRNCAQLRIKQGLSKGWDMENYLNILFIRSRPSGRYISRGSRGFHVEVCVWRHGGGVKICGCGGVSSGTREGIRKERGMEKTKKIERHRERGKESESQGRVVTRWREGDRAASVSAWNL